MNNLDVLAEQIYDWANSRRKDNLNKDGSPGDPRKISCPYKDTFDGVKVFYRSVAEFIIERDRVDNPQS